MPAITIELPSILHSFVGHEPAVELQAATLTEALRTLVRLHPALETHLFDETGAFREHVLCFVNDVNTRWLDGTTRPLDEGDSIRIMQAVSGG